jgi:cell volume regulation protein A
VFLAGVVAAHQDFVARRSTERFFDALTWLAQILMFLVLGLLVRPSELWELAPAGLALGFLMIFVARPLAVAVSLLPFRFTARENLFVGWVGLRGAVPVVLAIYPLLVDLPGASTLLGLVFLSVVGSALIQGTTLAPIARRLGLLEKGPEETDQALAPDIEEIELMVPFGSAAARHPLVELHLPSTLRIVMIGRGESLLVPDPEGGTVLEEGDILQVLASPADLEVLQSRLAPPSDEES